MLKLKLISLLFATSLISSCAGGFGGVTQIPRPESLVLDPFPEVDEMTCLPFNVYERVYTRDKEQGARIKTLESTIDSHNKK